LLEGVRGKYGLLRILRRGALLVVTIISYHDGYKYVDKGNKVLKERGSLPTVLLTCRRRSGSRSRYGVEGYGRYYGRVIGVVVVELIEVRDVRLFAVGKAIGIGRTNYYGAIAKP
jgi:hypothetical protein